MSDDNPYSTPASLVIDDSKPPEFGEIHFFRPSIRIGRLRYSAHLTMSLLCVYGVILVGIGIAFLIGSVDGIATTLLSILLGLGAAAIYIGIVVISFILAIQRLHDLNASGWLCLLMLIPLLGAIVPLVLLFAPGTATENNYGLPPPPNKPWHWILGLALPLLFIIGIIAAIAIPFMLK